MQMTITCEVLRRKQIGDEAIARLALHGIRAEVQDYSITGKQRNGLILLTLERDLFPGSFICWLLRSKEIIDFDLFAADDVIEVSTPVSHAPQGLCLKYEREKRGLSQLEVAKAIGIDSLTVSRWERGVSKPFPCYRKALCDFFDMSPEELGLLGRAG